MAPSSKILELPPSLQQKALEEINEDPRRTASDIQAIKEWLKKQPHLANCPIDDEEMILRFLRGCKFSLERTKEKLDTYFTLRGTLPEYFSKLDPLKSPSKEILPLGAYLPIPDATDKDGRAIVIIRSAAHDPKKFSQEEVFKCNMMVLEIFMRESLTLQVMGFSGILDMRGSTLGHMTQMRPPMIKKMMTMFQEGYPVRPKAINYTYMPQGFETVLSIFKGFMKEKMKKRLHLHGENMESLHQNVPIASLPKELGGTYPMDYDTLTDYWTKKVIENRKMLMEWEKYYTNEKKRPGKPKTYESLFGMEGSFRNLSID